MLPNATIVVRGNVGRDPDLRFTGNGAAVANFSVGSTPRELNRSTNEWVDGETLWLSVVAWRTLAENATQSLKAGVPVVVTGHLKVRTYTNKDGVEVKSYEIHDPSVAVDLERGTVEYAKNPPRAQGAPMSAPAAPAAAPAPGAPVSAPAAPAAAQAPAAAAPVGAGYEQPPF